MEESSSTSHSKKKSRGNAGGAGGGAAYGLGFIGALIYFIQSANSFWDGLYGVFQAIFWPAYLVYELLDFLRV